MQIHQLKRNHPHRQPAPIGRGGKRGKTAGRGTKGQRARAGAKFRPELRDIIKKLPKVRGSSTHGPLHSFQIKPVAVNLSALEKFVVAGSVVTPKSLVEQGLVNKLKGAVPAVKILGTGSLTKKLTFTGCLFSASSRLAVEKAGGTIN